MTKSIKMIVFAVGLGLLIGALTTYVTLNSTSLESDVLKVKKEDGVKRSDAKVSDDIAQDLKTDHVDNKSAANLESVEQSLSKISIKNYVDKEQYDKLNRTFLGVLNDLDEVSMNVLLKNGFPNKVHIDKLFGHDTQSLIDGVLRKEEWMENENNHIFHTHVLAKSLSELESALKFYRPDYKVGDPILLEGQRLGDGTLPIEIETALRIARESSITVYGSEAFTQLTLAKASLMNIYAQSSNTETGDLRTLKALSYLSNANERLPQIDVEEVLSMTSRGEELYPIYLAIHVKK